VFVVIFFIFMLETATLETPHHGAGPEMARVRHAIPVPGAVRDDSIHVALARDEQIFLGGRRVRLEELQSGIRDALAHGAERKIYFLVDTRTRYGAVKAVLTRFPDAGVQRVCFLVQESNKTATSATPDAVVKSAP
jgi:biopolymer transport protein ExbD